MNFARPDLLWWLLVLLAALAFFLVWAWRKKQSLLRQFVQARLLDTLTAGVSKGRQKARLIILFLGVACVAISLARPQWGTAWEETKQRGLDIVVAIDTSRSMLAADLAPNRLARAKLAALDLMREAKSDRLGLVAFAGTAFLQCPLTLDEEAFRQSVQALDTTIIPQGGSALAGSIRTALTAFEKEEDNYKVLVLFTDGEDHEEGALEAAKEASQAGLRIFTIGAGTAEGELLRVTDAKGNSDFLKDDQGNAVKSRLNEGLLRELATAANGFYLPLRGANVIETLYERGLAPLPKADISTKFIRRFHERFQWPLALGIVLLALEMFLSDRKKLPVQKAVLESASPLAKAVALVLLLTTLSVEASPAGARKDFQSGRYKEAQEEYARLAEARPGDPRLRYNAGAAAYRAGAFDDATEHFTAALRAEDVNLQQQAYYNLANTFYRAGETQEEPSRKINAWEQAVKHYEAAHKLKADDADAKFNHDLVKKKLEELKKQQEQQEQQQQQPKQSDKQDDQPKQDQRQNQDQQKQDQQSQQNQPSPKQDGERKDSQKDQPKPKDQTDQKQKEDGKSDQQTKEEQAGGQKDSLKKGEQKNPKSDQQGAKPQDENAQAQSGAVIGQMDLKQAMQLLDAQQGEVKALIFKPADSGKARAKMLKDW